MVTWYMFSAAETRRAGAKQAPEPAKQCFWSFLAFKKKKNLQGWENLDLPLEKSTKSNRIKL